PAVRMRWLFDEPGRQSLKRIGGCSAGAFFRRPSPCPERRSDGPALHRLADRDAARSAGRPHPRPPATRSAGAALCLGHLNRLLLSPRFGVIWESSVLIQILCYALA